ncbi:uncharacterized protein OCT59_008328 [Rhizophagus irregularis]|nr:hypothetical protein OCT59_008328 [Rhizophagus irregularis]
MRQIIHFATRKYLEGACFILFQEKGSSMSRSESVKMPREKSKTPESYKSSLVNRRNLAYNILKNLEDGIIGDKGISRDRPMFKITISTIQDFPLSHSSGTSALSNIMSERFILTSPIIRDEMERRYAEANRNEGIAIQRVKIYLTD